MIKNSTNAPELPPVPDAARPLLEDVLPGGSLGASRNIRQINNLLCVIAEEWETPSGEDLVETLRRTGNYFIATRGRNTPAIGNAISFVLKGLEQTEDGTIAEVREFIRTRRDEYNAQSERNVQAIAEFGTNALSGCETILSFDYSSTMMAILKQLAEEESYMRLIVPESRDLDGGRPIAQEATRWGHFVNFVIDVAFHHFMQDTDAILIGAETIFANGDCWNTVGSFPIAALAENYQVPFYVATELIKIDARSFRGIRKPIAKKDYSEMLDYPSAFEHPELISVSTSPLDKVPGSLVTAYITERGILLPEHLRRETEDFLESIGVSPLHYTSDEG